MATRNKPGIAEVEPADQEAAAATAPKQPVRVIEAPPREEFTSDGRTKEPDTSQGVRSRVAGVGQVPLTTDVMQQLREGAAANGQELNTDPPLNPPDESGPEEHEEGIEQLEDPGSARPQITTAATLHPDPHAVRPVYTDPSRRPKPPVPAHRTRIAIGAVDEAIVAEEKMVKVKPRATCQRWIGPYRYNFTKDVVCEVPQSVLECLAREDLIVPYFH